MRYTYVENGLLKIDYAKWFASDDFAKKMGLMTNKSDAQKRLESLDKTTEGAGNDVVEIVVVLDSSGSMGGLKKETIENYNNFVKEQQALPGKANLRLIKFSSHTVVGAANDLSKAELLTDASYLPNGWTALYDAIGVAFDELNRINPKYAILVILTDGEENYSRKTNRWHVTSAISLAQAKGWRIVYLGANQDAFHEASKIGISPVYTQGYSADAHGLLQAKNFASASTLQYRGSVSNMASDEELIKLKSTA